MINIEFVDFDFVVIDESTLNIITRVNDTWDKITWIWYKHFRKVIKMLKSLLESIVFKKWFDLIWKTICNILKFNENTLDLNKVSK